MNMHEEFTATVARLISVLTNAGRGFFVHVFVSVRRLSKKNQQAKHVLVGDLPADAATLTWPHTERAASLPWKPPYIEGELLTRFWSKNLI